MTWIHAELDKVIGILAAGGPWVFFLAFALLPCVGVPTSIFSLTAGTIFRARMGITGVVAAALAATMANIGITYVIGKGPLRHVLQRFMAKRGHKLPEIGSKDAKDVIILTRVSPLPFFVKNYLLSMADVPLAPYVVISLVVEGVFTAGFVVFGDALMHGEGRMIVLGGTVIVVAIAGTHLVRRHMGSKAKASASSPPASP